ncbi:nitrate/nitrite transporter [Mycobacterium parmense]|uniref:MFS transporter n=1 Tax=Mycobacterium parmense TaxID=185642 RepID=A0A7I7YLZ9_9MYCO|nr:nitrate/nitrite transporter [Mycobacterium parmense]MCV7349252.1 NarK/NasA family nitrate transporter [Mycobacterium parmense]BBZ42866.1 MFS transporter [Mycobacterium parmense]
MGRSHTITVWDPEDETAWDAGNRAIARRNLFWQVVNVHVAFSVWYLWSVMVLFMPQSVYGFSTGDKLLVGAVASLVGGLARIPYAFAANWFGGRNWTMFSAAILLIPTTGAIFLLSHPGLPLWPYLLCAALTGLGGGNYSASLAKVDGLFPQRLKGLTLGLIGGMANLGSAGIQIVGLVVLATAGHEAPYWVCAVYLVLLAVGGVGAALFMDNVAAHRTGLTVANLRSILSVPDTWAISFFYMCASGSFLGFAFAFGQVLQHNFVAAGQGHGQASLHAAEVAFIGPLLGSLARIIGGKVSDRYGGGHVTLAVFAAAILAGGFLVAVSTHDDLVRAGGGTVTSLTMAGYIVGFIALFVFCGAAKGAVYKLIPSVFEERGRALGLGNGERHHWARVRSGALIGFAGACGALGGVGIDLALRESYDSVGTETPAFWVFLACYVAAAFLVWVRYVRPGNKDVTMPESRQPTTEETVRT